MNAPLIGGIVAVVVGALAALIGFRRPSKALKVVGPLVALAGIAICLLFAPTNPPPEAWQRHATLDGVCSIEFPEQPQRDTQTDKDGTTVSALDVSISARNIHYSLSYSDLSEEDANRPGDKLFNTLLLLYMRPRPDAPRSEILKEQVLNERGFAGREYHLKRSDDLVSRIKVFVSGRRVYRAIAVNPPGADADRDAQRFLDSFRFEVPKP